MAAIAVATLVMENQLHAACTLIGVRVARSASPAAPVTTMSSPPTMAIATPGTLACRTTSWANSSTVDMDTPHVVRVRSITLLRPRSTLSRCVLTVTVGRRFSSTSGWSPTRPALCSTGSCAPAGSPPRSSRLYSALRSRDGTTPTQLAALMGLPPTTVSSVVGRLESRGHIQRFPNPPDARSYQIRLTPAGRATHKAATKLFAPVLGEVQDALTVPLDEARTVLVVIAAAVRAATE